VLHWLAQTQTPDTGAWTITTFVALAGAIISLATLVVTTWATGQRERAKWARETLAEAFFDFVDTSYTAANATTKLYRGLVGDAAPETRAADTTEMERQHSLLRHHLTKIRLLAPTHTLERAQTLRRAHADFLHAVEPELGEERMRQLRREVARAREEFIVSAKKAMSLPK
jgi:ribosomal protein L29